MQIVSANLNHLIYSKGHPTQVFTAPLPFAPEDDATLLAWDQETHTLSYSVPPATEDGEPTLIDRVITQAEIDAGAASFQPTLEELKAAKIRQLKQERDAAWQGDLMTSFGVPFHTDIQTQIDIQMILQMLDPLEVFSGYKCADGVRRDLTREQFALALNEGVVRKVTAFAVEGAKLTAVEAATTAEELAAI